MIFNEIKSFMVIGAHCDDVDIRCGGTFSRLIREGKRGAYVVAVENAYIRKDHPVADVMEALELRRKESLAAAKMLGTEKVYFLKMKSFYLEGKTPHERIYPDFSDRRKLLQQIDAATLYGTPPVANALNFQECIKRLNEIIDEFSPELIFTNSPDDKHPDHYALACFVSEIILQKKKDGSNIELMFFEPGSSGPVIGFNPNVFIELSKEDVTKKQKLIDVYDSQFPAGLTDNFAKERALAYGKLAGAKYAEAFCHACCPNSGAWEGESDFIKQLYLKPKTPIIYRLPDKNSLLQHHENQKVTD